MCALYVCLICVPYICRLYAARLANLQVHNKDTRRLAVQAYVYDDVTYLYDDVTYLYDDVTYVYDMTYVYDKDTRRLAVQADAKLRTWRGVLTNRGDEGFPTRARTVPLASRSVWITSTVWLAAKWPTTLELRASSARSGSLSLRQTAR